MICHCSGTAAIVADPRNPWSCRQAVRSQSSSRCLIFKHRGMTFFIRSKELFELSGKLKHPLVHAFLECISWKRLVKLEE